MPEAFFIQSAVPEAEYSAVVEAGWRSHLAAVGNRHGDQRGQAISYAPLVFGANGNPLLLGDPALPRAGTPVFDVIFHELGHNIHSDPLLYNWVGIPGAFYQETIAEWFVQHTLAELTAQPPNGVSADTMARLAQVARDNQAYHQAELEQYVARGSPFDYFPTTNGSHPLVGMIHTYSAVTDWQRLPAFLDLFRVARYPAYAPVLNAHGGIAPIPNRVTWFLRGLQEVYGCDVRPDFRALNFPINDSLYLGLDAALTPTPGTGVPYPLVQPALHDYGSVVVNGTVGHDFQLSNRGCGPMVVGSVYLTGTGASAFRLNESCSGRTLTWAKRCALTVTFAPAAGGRFDAAVVIPSDAPQTTPRIAVSGTAVGGGAGGSSGGSSGAGGGTGGAVSSGGGNLGATKGGLAGGSSGAGGGGGSAGGSGGSRGGSLGGGTAGGFAGGMTGSAGTTGGFGGGIAGSSGGISGGTAGSSGGFGGGIAGSSGGFSGGIAGSSGGFGGGIAGSAGGTAGSLGGGSTGGSDGSAGSGGSAGASGSTGSEGPGSGRCGCRATGLEAAGLLGLAGMLRRRRRAPAPQDSARPWFA